MGLPSFLAEVPRTKKKDFRLSPNAPGSLVFAQLLKRLALFLLIFILIGRRSFADSCANIRSVCSSCLTVSTPSDTIPGEPLNQSLTTATPKHHVLQWTTTCPSDPCVNPEGFEIYRFSVLSGCPIPPQNVPDDQNAPGDWTPFVVLHDPLASYYVDALGFDTTTYTYVVRAFNGARGCHGINSLRKTVDTTSTCPTSTPALTADTPTCAGERLSVPSGVCANFQWYRNGLPIPGARQSPYVATLNGTYSYTCLDSSCPAFSSSASVTIPAPPVASIYGPGSMCVGDGGSLRACSGSASATCSGSTCPDKVTYQWYRDGILQAASSQTITPTASGTYTCILGHYTDTSCPAPNTNPNEGCVSSAPGHPITVYRVPPLGVNLRDSSCSSLTLKLSGFRGITPSSVGATDITWYRHAPGTFVTPTCGNYPSSTGWIPICTTNGPDVDNCVTTTMGTWNYLAHFEVLVDGHVCCGDTPAKPFTVGVPTPTVSTTSGSLVGCNQVVLNSSTSSEYLAYQWEISTDGGGNYYDITDATASTYIATETGMYRVYVTGQSGCLAIATGKQVTIVGTPQASAASATFVTYINSAACPGGSTGCATFSLTGANFRSESATAVYLNVVQEYQSTTYGQPNSVCFSRGTGSSCTSGLPLTLVNGTPDTLSFGGTNTPDFKRPVICTIEIQQADCARVPVLDATGRRALYVAVANNQILASPRLGTSYGGAPVRLFGRNLPASGTLTFGDTSHPGQVVTTSPTEWTVRTGAHPFGSVGITLTSGSTWTTPTSPSLPYRFATFGIVSIPVLGAYSGPLDVPGAYLFTADAPYQLVNGDPYTSAATPVPIFKNVTGGAGFGFGYYNPGSPTVPNRSWVYVGEPDRLYRFDTGSYQVDSVFGVPYIPNVANSTDGMIHPREFELGLDKIKNFTTDGSINPDTACLPFQCILCRFECTYRFPGSTSYFFSNITTDEKGRVFALVTQASRISSPCQNCPPIVSRYLQLWAESQSLSTPQAVYTFGNNSDTLVDKIWADNTDQRALVATIDSDVTPTTIGVRSFALGDPTITPLPVTDLGVLSNPTGGVAFVWPESDLVKIPTTAGSNSYVAFYDSAARQVRQINLTGATPSFRTTAGTGCTGSFFNVCTAPNNICPTTSSAMASSLTVGRKSDNSGAWGFMAYHDPNVTYDGKVRRFSYNTCGVLPTTYEQPTWLGSTNGIYKARHLALRSDGLAGFFSTDTNSIKVFNPAYANGTGTNTTTVIGIIDNLPGVPTHMRIQTVLTATLIGVSMQETATSLAADAFASPDDQVVVESQILDLQTALDGEGASVNAAIGSAERLLQTISRDVTDPAAEIQLINMDQTIIDLLLAPGTATKDGDNAGGQQ